MSFLSKSLAIARKEALAEMRTREMVFAVLVFTLLVLVIFNFTTGVSPQVVHDIAPGLLWATFSFSGVLALNRSFVREKENGCLDGLMACPADREVIYAGKALSSLVFMLSIEIIALVIFTLLFNVNVLSLPLILITFLATIGFAAVGTLFSALSANTRAREMVLPILFLPVVLPVVISAVQASEKVLDGKSWGGLSPYLQLILAFDVVITAVSYLVFAYVIEQ
jgi:heme exporter protein B